MTGLTKITAFLLPFVLLLSGLFQLHAVKAQDLNLSHSLNGTWELQRRGDTTSFSATVPGYTHEALLEAGVIDDLHDENIQLWAQYDWQYTLNPFDIPQELLDQNTLELVFDGLDTFASVYLNDSLILTADNYFRTFRLDVKQLCLTAGNSLVVNLRSPFSVGEERIENLSHPLPGDDIRAVARKPQYHYGWDWGPKITPAGIHRDVHLEAGNGIRLHSPEVRTLAIDGQTALVEFNAVVNAQFDGIAELSIDLSDAAKTQKFSAFTELKKGPNQVNHRFELLDAKLWWTHELGVPDLYQVNASIMMDEKRSSVEFKTGIRTIRLETEDDDYGQGFRFVLNGIPLFMRGANYIPPSIFERSFSTSALLQTLEEAKSVHMNMLRVWGGGVYERDEFYSWCNENGVLVWQDFMYACAMYPGDDSFIANAIAEAEEQTLRLRKHPSIALWCGNNEVSEGWHRWGWQDGLSETQKVEVFASYQRLFQQKLPEVTALHTNTDYWESSPMLGRGDPEHIYRGDAHYWGVWHDDEPFEMFNARVPRFMSEFGFQSMPSAYVMDNYWTEPLDTAMASIERFQKHPRGFALMNTYMKRSYREAHDFKDWSYLTQLVQRDGVVMGIRAHRASSPYCMGSLYWQLNDCWPGISWSSIDFARQKKALHYALDVALSPVSMWFVNAKGNVILISANDLPYPVTLPYKYRFHSFDATPISLEQTGKWTATSGAKGANIWLSQLKGYEAYSKGEAYLHLEWNYRGKVHQQFLLVAPTKFLKLPSAQVSWSAAKHEKHYEIELTSDSFARDICIESSVAGNFSENFFDLPAGWSKKVTFTSFDSDEDPDFQIRWLNKVP